MKRCMGCMAELEEEYLVCPGCGYAEGTPPREAYHLNPGTILGGRYIAGRVLGFGGFGVTYIGWDEQLQRKVAIKEFLPSSFATRMPGFTQVSVFGGEATEQFHAGLQRFVDEAMRLAKFNGIPGIVDIYDTFVENNTAYIVMEYLQGRDVKQKLERDGVFSYEDARAIILSVCETLRIVHREGMIHRDISPDNIYLTDDGEAKLLDFGASRYATSINSKSLSVILKAGYAPEEQYRSRGDQGSWSDVYALSATFYKMITGITPMDSMERAIQDELEEPSKLGVDLPKSGEIAILNALNVRKENRTKTVEEFGLQLNSDGVERVREKARKSDSGGLPLWGKVLLGGGLGLTLLFGLLTVTGVVNFGQGNLLKDSFGPAVAEGYVNAPGIVNLMEEEAQKQVKKAGLDYLITGKEYSDSIAKGKILSQTPLPGRVMALGELIEVIISGGSRQDAIQAGEMEMPDISFMDIRDAMFAMDELGFFYYTEYEYSDTVAEGLVVRYEPYESGQGAKIIVSVGRKGQQGTYGEIRAPFYHPDQGVLLFSSTVEQTLEDGIEHKIQYSLDGGNSWSFLKDMDGGDFSNYSTYYIDKENRPISEDRISVAQLIIMANPGLCGKEMKLKLVRYSSGGRDEIIDEKEVPGSIVVEAEPWEFQISGVEALTWDEIGKMNDRGEIQKYHRYSYALDQENWRENETPIRLTGDFKKDHYYQLITNINEISYGGEEETWNTDGFFYGTVNNYEKEQMESNTVNWYLLESSQGEMKEGQKTVVRMKAPVPLTLKNWEFQEDGSGKPFLDAAFPYLKSGWSEVIYEESSQETGTVIRESLGQQNVFTVSAGELTPQPNEGQILTTSFWPEQYDDLLTACLYLNPDEYAYNGDYPVVYSTDGGNNFQTLTNREGKQMDVYSYGDNSGKVLNRMGGGDTARTLFQERTDLWGQDLVLGIQGPINRSVAKERFRIVDDHPSVSLTGFGYVEMSQLPEYEDQGRLPDDGFLSGIYDNYQNGYATDARIIRLEGNFRAGSTYFVIPGGTRNAHWSFECVRDGELFFLFYKDSNLTEEVRTDYRNTVIQTVNYEYIQESGQLVAHISPMAIVDIEKALDY